MFGTSGNQETELRWFSLTVKRLLHMQAAGKDRGEKQRRWMLQKLLVNEVVEWQALYCFFWKCTENWMGWYNVGPFSIYSLTIPAQLAQPQRTASFSTAQDSRACCFKVFYSDSTHQILNHIKFHINDYAAECILPSRNSFSKFHLVSPGLALTLTQQV